MKATLYLIRHGDPELSNTERIFYGSTDLPLSEKGKERARTLRPFMETLKPDRVVSSPLRRCRETAEESGASKNYPITTLNDLSELDMGDWEMLSVEKVASENPGILDLRWDEIENFRPPRGECFQDLANRVVPALREVAKDGGVTAVFGHAGVFMSVLWKEFNISLKTLFSIRQDFCGIHVINYGSKTELAKANWSPSATPWYTQK